MKGKAVSLVVALLIVSGCSMQRLAVNKLGDALANGGTTFSADDDPELVGAALPFSLKLMESLLAESPRHRNLLVATARGFTQYTYGWIGQQADEVEPFDIAEATRQRARARSLYLRARDYGLRALGPAIGGALRGDPKRAMALARKDDVPALYWTAAAWGLAISVSKDDPELVADLPLVEALILRAAELDPAFESGSIDTFLITWEASRPEHAQRHFARAVELSGGRLASPYLAYAEAISVQAQKRDEFEDLLGRALRIDPAAAPEWRLQNVIAQRRARWLLSRVTDLFFDEQGGTP